MGYSLKMGRLPRKPSFRGQDTLARNMCCERVSWHLECESASTLSNMGSLCSIGKRYQRLRLGFFRREWNWNEPILALE